MQRCCFGVELVNVVFVDVGCDGKGTHNLVWKFGNTSKMAWLDIIRVEVVTVLALAKD